MTPDQITASIEALQPAPAGESLHRIAVRAAAWLLSTIADEHPAIAQTHALYVRAAAGDAPTDDEWDDNFQALSNARCRASDSGRARNIAISLAHVRARTRIVALNTALNSDRATLRLLGDRLQPVPGLDRAILHAVQTPGCALDMDAWHTCDTTHCRAGWAVVLHPMGRELEAAFGTEMAGRLIYLRSTGRVPDFFASDEDAMADIIAHAGAL